MVEGVFCAGFAILVFGLSLWASKIMGPIGRIDRDSRFQPHLSDDMRHQTTYSRPTATQNTAGVDTKNNVEPRN
jgi:hypothetical protein